MTTGDRTLPRMAKLKCPECGNPVPPAAGSHRAGTGAGALKQVDQQTAQCPNPDCSKPLYRTLSGRDKSWRVDRRRTAR